jgi:NDP-sugar pyrophosphorylase family protein
LATLTAVQAPGRFGALKLQGHGIQEFAEKPLGDGSWINGGFFVLSPEIFDYIEPGEELVEQPFQRLIEADQLMAYPYDGFTASMDTFKDKQHFDELYSKGKAPWEVWLREPGSSNGRPHLWSEPASRDVKGVRYRGPDGLLSPLPSRAADPVENPAWP